MKKKMKQISVSEEVHKELKDLAADLGMAVHSLTERSLVIGLKEYKKRKDIYK